MERFQEAWAGGEEVARPRRTLRGRAKQLFEGVQQAATREVARLGENLGRQGKQLFEDAKQIATRLGNAVAPHLPELVGTAVQAGAILPGPQQLPLGLAHIAGAALAPALVRALPVSDEVREFVDRAVRQQGRNIGSAIVAMRFVPHPIIQGAAALGDVGLGLAERFSAAQQHPFIGGMIEGKRILPRLGAEIGRALGSEETGRTVGEIADLATQISNFSRTAPIHMAGRVAGRAMQAGYQAIPKIGKFAYGQRFAHRLGDALGESLAITPVLYAANPSYHSNLGKSAGFAVASALLPFKPVHRAIPWVKSTLHGIGGEQ